MSSQDLLSQGSERQMERLLEENARLRRQLDDCTSSLTKLSGSIDQITDADIEQNFEDLHNAVEQALNQFLDLEGRFTGWDKIVPNRLDEAICRSVGIPEHLFSAQLQTILASTQNPLDKIAWLSGQQCCDCMVVSLIVWRFLEQRIFAERNPLSGFASQEVKCGDSKDSDFIEDILRLLTGGSQVIAPLSQSTFWKSEALKAIKQLPGFRDRQEKLIEAMAGSLHSELQQCISTKDLGKLNSFCHECVQLAVEMVTNMACSSQIYEVSRGPMSYTPVPTGNFRDWKLRSISTWRAPPDGIEPVPVVVLAPGLYNVRHVGNHSLGEALVKPILAVSQEGPTKARAHSSAPNHEPLQLAPVMPKSAELTANVPENKDESRRRRPSRKHRSTAETARRRSRSKESLIGVKHAPGWRDCFTNSKKILFWRRSPPVSPQSDSRASTASEGRGNGHKEKVSEKTKRRIINPPSREESQSGESEPYGGRFTNTGHCDEPQTLHANGRHVHISDSDVLEVPKTDLPRRASTAPSDGRSSSADHMIVRGPSANQNQEPKRRDVSRRSHQQHDREDGISFTPLAPASYSGPRRRPPNAQSRSKAF